MRSYFLLPLFLGLLFTSCKKDEPDIYGDRITGTGLLRFGGVDFELNQGGFTVKYEESDNVYLNSMAFSLKGKAIGFYHAIVRFHDESPLNEIQHGTYDIIYKPQHQLAGCNWWMYDSEADYMDTVHKGESKGDQIEYGTLSINIENGIYEIYAEGTVLYNAFGNKDPSAKFEYRGELINFHN